MRKLLLLALALPLASCATVPNIDICKYAGVRRATYTTAIRAADAYVLSGRPVPYEVTLGRQAAATALAVLDQNCPPIDPG